jgi:hypothetical protein
MHHFVTKSPNAVSILICSCDRKKIKVLAPLAVLLWTRIRGNQMFRKGINTLGCNKITRRQCFNLSWERGLS